MGSWIGRRADGFSFYGGRFGVPPLFMPVIALSGYDGSILSQLLGKVLEHGSQKERGREPVR